MHQEKSVPSSVLCQIVGIPVNWSSDKRGLTVYDFSYKAY